MLRPFPVVDVPTECRNGHGRCCNETDVAIDKIESHIILLTRPHRTQVRLIFRIFLFILLFENETQLPDSEMFTFGKHLLLESIHLIRDVDDLFQEKHILSGNISLFLALERPKSVFEIVPLRSAYAVDVGIGAVVVGDEKTLVRDYASRTSEIQGHHRIAQSRPLCIRIVNLPGSEFQPPSLHILLQSPVNRVNHPHPLVRRRHQSRGNHKRQG